MASHQKRRLAAQTIKLLAIRQSEGHHEKFYIGIFQ